MTAMISMLDSRSLFEIACDTTEQALDIVNRLPISVGTIRYGDGSIYYVGYVGEHCVGEFHTKRQARLAAEQFDRSQLIA